MFDPKLYHEACRELRAPEEKIEEILTMAKNGNTKKQIRPVRTLLVAAAAIAMMAVGVSAANPEAMQGIFARITTVVCVDEFRQEMATTDGEEITVFSVPKIEIKDQDGRAVLIIDEEQTDITDALAQEGSYVYEKNTQEGTSLTVSVKGSGAEDWTMEVSMRENGQEAFSYRTESGEDSLGIGTAVEGMPGDWSVNVEENSGNISAEIAANPSQHTALDKEVSD